MPLQMRLPKRGFKNPNRTAYVACNVSNLQAISEKHKVTDITVEKLYELGYIKKNDKVKVLGNGDLSASLNLTVHAISAKAKEIVEGKGGSVNIL